MTVRPQTQPRRRPAFTLLEVLIAVGLIAVLSTLLVIGIKQLTSGSKRNQARVELQQAKALFDAWQAVAHQPFPPTPLPAPENVTPEFAMIGPPNGTPNPNGQFGRAVWFTRDVMFQIRSVPANAAALGKLSASGTMTFPSTQGMPFSPTLYSNTVDYTPFTSGNYGRVFLKDPTNPSIYTYYQAIQYVPVNGPGPNNKAYWLPAYPATTGGAATYADTSVPVLIDAWGNPMILVPGGALGVMPNPANLDPSSHVVIPGTGAMVSGTGSAALPVQVRSPDGRPFFASAGPDGNFSTADDNLYSFEK